jgi:hypothetical protein
MNWDCRTVTLSEKVEAFSSSGMSRVCIFVCLLCKSQILLAFAMAILCSHIHFMACFTAFNRLQLACFHPIILVSVLSFASRFLAARSLRDNNPRLGDHHSAYLVVTGLVGTACSKLLAVTWDRSLILLSSVLQSVTSVKSIALFLMHWRKTSQSACFQQLTVTGVLGSGVRQLGSDKLNIIVL